MSYLTPVDQTVLLALAIGLCSGALTGCLEAGLTRWLEKTWLGWDAVIRSIVLYTLVTALLFSAGAFVMTIFDASKPLPQINQTIFRLGVFFPAIPLINALSTLLSKRISASQDQSEQ